MHTPIQKKHFCSVTTSRIGLNSANKNVWRVAFFVCYILRRRRCLSCSLCIFYWISKLVFMFSGFWTTILSHYQAVWFRYWAVISEYIARLEPGDPHIPLTPPPPHYSVSVCLTFRIYPLTSSGRILTCRSLNLKVCRLSSGPHGKICVPPLIYRTIRRPTNICYTTEEKKCHNATSALCHFWYWQEKRVDLFQITFILSELHATDGAFKLVIGLSPGYGACPPHPRHSPYSPPLLRPCCWRL